MTPPLNATGRFILRDPFIAKETTVYRCIALRKFDDLVEIGANIFEDYYQPVGLSVTDFQNDDRVDAVIVTLMDPSGEVIYVPDTYIVSYPNMGDVTYHRIVLSIGMGPIPSFLPLEHLQSQISGMVSDVIGVDSDVRIHAAPALGAVSPEQHEIMEAARANRINRRGTDRARFLQEQNKVTALQERVQILEQIILEAGLLPD